MTTPFRLKTLTLLCTSALLAACAPSGQVVGLYQDPSLQTTPLPAAEPVVPAEPIAQETPEIAPAVEPALENIPSEHRPAIEPTEPIERATCKACEANQVAKEPIKIAPRQAEISATPITEGNASGLHGIIQSALLYNLSNSPLPMTVQQREAEAEAIRKNHWPTVQPTASLDSSGGSYAGVNASYTLLDFGASTQRERQGDLAIDSSNIDFDLEQRGIAADVVNDVAAIAALREKATLLNRSLTELQKLTNFANIRLQAGYITESEPMLLNLRIAELKSELEANKVETALKIRLLSAKLVNPVQLSDVPSFSAMKSAIKTDLSQNALQLKQAQINVEIAQAKLKQTESERLPQVAVEGNVGVANKLEHNVALVMKSPTSVFAGGANVRAADAAYRAAQQAERQTVVKLTTERERIELETQRLQQNRKTLQQLERESEQSVAQFYEQFQAATATLSDGISAHKTLLQTRQQLVDLEVELLSLKASEIRISDGIFLN